MLVKILKSKVDKVWSIIAPMIKRAMPNVFGTSDRNMVNVLESMLSGDLTGWWIYDEQDEPQLLGLVTTHFTYDIHGGDKNLTVYTIYGINNIPKGIWMEGFKTLAKYAEANNCKDIIAYTSLEGVKSIASKLGADTSITLIRMEI